MQAEQIRQEIAERSRQRDVLLGRLHGLSMLLSIRIRTGVINTNAINLDWLDTEEQNGIDLRQLAHDEDCNLDDHDECDLENWGDQILIGGWQLLEGKWRPDTTRSAGYAATVNLDHFTIEVQWSKWAAPTRNTSPCYPGCGNLDEPDTDAIMLAYSLPPDAIPTDHPIAPHIQPR